MASSAVEDTRRTHEDASGPCRAAFRSYARIRDKMRDGTQEELIFPNPDGGTFSEECDARRTGSPSAAARHGAWIPLDSAPQPKNARIILMASRGSAGAQV